MKFSRIIGRSACGGLLAAASGALLSFHPPTAADNVSAATVRRGPVRIHQRRNDTQFDSYNWSGYAVTGANGSVTDVKGSWIVPAVTCPSTTTTSSASSFWVGIDGFNSKTVEQIGTDSDCVVSQIQAGRTRTTTVTPSYYAWFEFYPQNSYVILFPHGIAPGDAITAEVTYEGTTPASGRQAAGSKFTVTITDTTKGETFSTTSTVTGAMQSSAEWVVEAPSSNSGILPLSDFGTATFLSSAATVAGATTGANATTAQELIMVGERGTHAIKALPLAATSTGGFSDAWESAGP